MRWIKASVKPPTGVADEYSWRRASDKQKFNPVLNINGNILEYAWLRSEFSFDEVEYLDETPPAIELMAIEQEAQELYPNDSRDMTDTMLADAQRLAYITAARQYMGEIEKLTTRVKELEDHLKGIYEMYGDEWTNYAQEWTEKVLRITQPT